MASKIVPKTFWGLGKKRKTEMLKTRRKLRVTRGNITKHKGRTSNRKVSFSSGLEEQAGGQGCPERALGCIWDDLGEHLGAVRSAKAARKEGRKGGEALAQREQREAERKDKESTQVSKQTSTSNQERERERCKQRKSEGATSSSLL